MKQMSAITTVIIAAAVLVAAYAIGLLVREIRMGRAPTGSDVTALDHGAIPHGPGAGHAQAVKAPGPLETKEGKEELLKKMSNLTEEQKQRFRDQVRNGVTPNANEQGRIPLKERDRRMQKWQSMSQEERKAFEERQRKLEGTVPQQQGPGPDANQPAGTTVEQGVKTDGSKTKDAAQNPAPKSNQ